MPSPDQHRFQVDLSGLIDLLSHHLYSSPVVFIREMLQNAVDAAAARRRIEPDHAGTIQVELIQQGDGLPTLMFHDDGIGLTEDEVHQFLATIGQSSKRGSGLERPSDFLGQFGIGLLSGFMVTDEIVVITRTAKPGGHRPVQWRGKVDGTYEVKTIDADLPVGTQVFLRAKPTATSMFTAGEISTLLRHYGEFLPIDIQFTHESITDSIGATPPWDEAVGDAFSREALLAYGQRVFERDFWDVIPLRSQTGGVQGMAFVLAQATHLNARHPHRVYLKNMLLSASQQNLLPDWAFFVQCVVNAGSLRPTASRESFYEDEALETTRRQLGACLRRYLVDLAQRDPTRLQQLLSIHHLALKALALEDEECLTLFADWFPFETSLGTMTLGEFRKEHTTIRYVRTLDEFRQIAQVAAAESLAVVNAGYVYDAEILECVAAVRPDLRIEPFDVDALSDRFEELTLDEREEIIDFERLADVILQPHKTVVEMAKFHPAELPALFVSNANANFLRSLEQAREGTDDLWGGVLDNIAAEVSPTYSRLYLNYHNSLVRRISSLNQRQAQRRCIEMLYVQALLLGHFPLQPKEFRLLSDGVTGLINWALDASQGDGHE